MRNVISIIAAVSILAACIDILGPTYKEFKRPKDGVTVECLEPPQAVVTTDVGARANAEAGPVKASLGGGLNFKKSVEIIRPGNVKLQAYNRRRWDACEMYGNGIIDKETYKQYSEQANRFLDNAFGQPKTPTIAEAKKATYIIPETKKVVPTISKAKIWFNSGKELWNGTRYNPPEDAIKFFSQAIKHDPIFADAYVARGVAYSELKIYKQATEDHEQAIRIDPNNVAAHFYKGRAFHALLEYSKAIEGYSRAIELNPRYAIVYVARARAYSDQGNYLKSIKDFTKAIELFPIYAAAYEGRGISHYQRNEYALAISNFNRAIEYNPRKASLRYFRGAAYFKSGKYTDAIKNYDQAIIIYPKYAAAYSARGIANTQMNAYIPAIKNLNTAIELDPGFASNYYWRGRALKGLGSHKQACEDWKIACDNGHNFACNESKQELCGSPGSQPAPIPHDTYPWSDFGRCDSLARNLGLCE